MYKSSMIENAKTKRKVWDFLDKGIVRLSSSPCGYPIMLVLKKDDTWRLGIDF